jgi:thioredoxin 1
LVINYDAVIIVSNWQNATILTEIEMSDKIVQLTDDSFDTDVITASGLVLVDFWAEWCGPCKMIAPLLNDIAEEYAEKVTVGKLNIDQNSVTPPKYGIRGIPTLLLFKDGVVADTKVGALSKTQLKEFIDKNL